MTNFGNRFDVYNDATVVDVVRDEDQPGFSKLFADVVTARFPELAEKRFASDLGLDTFEESFSGIRPFDQALACTLVLEVLHVLGAVKKQKIAQPGATNRVQRFPKPSM